MIMSVLLVQINTTQIINNVIYVQTSVPYVKTIMNALNVQELIDLVIFPIVSVILDITTIQLMPIVLIVRVYVNLVLMTMSVHHVLINIIWIISNVMIVQISVLYAIMTQSVLNAMDQVENQIIFQIANAAMDIGMILLMLIVCLVINSAIPVMIILNAPLVNKGPIEYFLIVNVNQVILIRMVYAKNVVANAMNVQILLIIAYVII